MVIFVNYKYNYDTTAATANKSMDFDLSAIQSCLDLLCPWNPSKSFVLSLGLREGIKNIQTGRGPWFFLEGTEDF